MKKFIMFACCVAAQGTIFSSEVLLTLQGKPEITVADFENYKENFFTAQPNYRQVLQFMPSEEQIRLDKNMFENMAHEIILKRWLSEQSVDTQKEFSPDKQKAFNEEQGPNAMLIDYYLKVNPVQVSPSASAYLKSVAVLADLKKKYNAVENSAYFDQKIGKIEAKNQENSQPKPAKPSHGRVGFFKKSTQKK